MTHSPIEWEIKKAYNRGFDDGYGAGTEHMRRAYGNNQVGTARAEASFRGAEPDDARVQGDMARPDNREEICLHNGEEDASDCPNAETHDQPDDGRVRDVAQVIEDVARPDDGRVRYVAQVIEDVARPYDDPLKISLYTAMARLGFEDPRDSEPPDHMVVARFPPYYR